MKKVQDKTGFRLPPWRWRHCACRNNCTHYLTQVTAVSKPSLSHSQQCKVPGGCGTRLLTGVQILNKKCSSPTTPNPLDGQPSSPAHFHLKATPRTRAALIWQRSFAVSLNLQIGTATSKTVRFLFRKGNMFRSKQTVIRPPLHKLYNKVQCSVSCIVPYFKVVQSVFVLVSKLRRSAPASSSYIYWQLQLAYYRAVDRQSWGPQFLQLSVNSTHSVCCHVCITKTYGGVEVKLLSTVTVSTVTKAVGQIPRNRDWIHGRRKRFCKSTKRPTRPWHIQWQQWALCPG
jgi:hypothetical protein